MLPAVEYAERSDPGRDPDKQVNEDVCGHRGTRFGHLCVVCDGMGGHAAGREAAELALATIFEVFDGAPDGSPPGEVLRGAIQEASRRVHVMPTSEVAMGRPGSTAVAVLVHAHGTEVCHVGDSRAYLVHEGQIFRITSDHSIVQELVNRGLLTPQQAAHHPDANRITRALGMAAEVEAELRPQPVYHVVGDAFVLCSDGLSDLVEDHEILAIVGNEPPAQAVGKLIDLANARGGHDNVTVIVLRTRESAIAPATGVAPTVAQTSVTQAPATLPASSGPATVVEPAHQRETEPGMPAPVAPPARQSTVPPPSSDVLPRRRRTSPLVIAAVLLAVGAILLLGAVVLEELDEQRGKHRRAATLSLPAADAQTGAPDAAPTPLAPESVVVPTASAPRDPIAPLVPSPAPTKTP
jgi:protein phosphatase